MRNDLSKARGICLGLILGGAIYLLIYAIV